MITVWPRNHSVLKLARLLRMHWPKVFMMFSKSALSYSPPLSPHTSSNQSLFVATFVFTIEIFAPLLIVISTKTIVNSKENKGKESTNWKFLKDMSGNILLRTHSRWLPSIGSVVTIFFLLTKFKKIECLFLNQKHLKNQIILSR